MRRQDERHARHAGPCCLNQAETTVDSSSPLDTAVCPLRAAGAWSDEAREASSDHLLPSRKVERGRDCMSWVNHGSP